MPWPLIDSALTVPYNRRASETIARLHEPLDIPDLALAMLAGPAALIAVLAEAVSALDQLIADGSSDLPHLSDTVDF